MIYEMGRSFEHGERMRKRLLVSWGTLLFVGLTVLGCDFFTNQSTTAGSTGFVYVVNSAQGAGGVGSISGYQANASTGVLSTLVNSPFGTGNLPTPTSMSADVLGRFVYVSTSAGVVGFVISQNTDTLGQLACFVNPCVPTATKAVPVAIAVDPSARAVYVVEAGPQVEGFTITAVTGALTSQGPPTPLSPPAANGVTPTSATVAASGGFLFVGMADGSIVSVPINANSTLNAAAISKAAPLAGITNVAALVADPTVSFVYAVDGTQFVSLYTINRSTGALTAVNSLSVQSSAPVGVAVASVNGTPTYVYTANQGSSNVSAFLIGGGGTLEALANFPFSVSATTPVALAVDPSQAFLYIVGKESNSVVSFVIVNGQLESPSTASTGTAPTAVVAVP